MSGPAISDGRAPAFSVDAFTTANRKATPDRGPGQASAENALLSIRDVSLRFGGIVALDGVSFDIERGLICGLIGPNGAGKTTLFNCLSRVYQPQSGAIGFDGADLLATPIHAIAALGIGRTFQNVALFATMTVRENVMVGGHCRSRGEFFANIVRLPFVAEEETRLAERTDTLIEILELGPMADTPVSALTFAVRKRVELARALASRPKLLLLDEPAGGLNHEEVDRLRELILSIRERFELTILLVEHHMNLVMRVSDKVVVLNFGRKIAEGTPDEVHGDPDVVGAYLGVEA
jgi:branched-chain amino acid transport system ATP-binding protein